MNQERLRDSEIFFAALLALASVLVGSRALSALVSMEAGIAFAPSLLARFGPSTTVANFSTFFVLLPTALAFIAIGIPFALRTVAAAWQRKLTRIELIGMGAMIAATAGLLVEARSGGTGIYGFTAMVALAYWQLVPSIARRGARVGNWAMAAAGISALGLARYHWSYIGGAEASQFVAPTLLVVTFYAAVAGVALCLPGALITPRKRTAITVLLCSAAALWLAAPQFRSHAATMEEADQLEFMVAAGNAAALLLLSFLGQRKR